MPSWCHWWIVSSGTLRSMATSSVVKRASAPAPACSPASGTFSGAIAVGGQFGSGQDHNTGIARSYGQRDGLRLGGPGDSRREIGEMHGFADRPGVVVGSWDDHDVTGTNLIIGAVIHGDVGPPETTYQ